MKHPEPLLNTTQLIERYRHGDQTARDALVERYLPLLRKWAHGRLPKSARDLSETDDLVQITFLRALNRLDAFESQHPGAFLAYLRTILISLVRDEFRRRSVRVTTQSLVESVPTTQASVVEEAVGQETLETYERALMKLSEDARNAVIMRVEFDMTYAQIASELECPSDNAARMMVTRALRKLAQFMTD